MGEDVLSELADRQVAPEVADGPDESRGTEAATWWPWVVATVGMLAVGLTAYRLHTQSAQGTEGGAPAAQRA